MASKGKSTSDNQHRQVIQAICQCYDKDSENSNFFRLLESESPQYIQVDENQIKPVSKQKQYIVNNSTEHQKDYKDITNNITISEAIEYPDIVERAFRQLSEDTEELIYIGYFSQAGFFYCIFNTTLFLFSKPKRNENNEISYDIATIEAEYQINSCDIGFPDPQIYDEKVVSYILYYSTQTSIGIVPIGKTCDQIFKEKIVTVPTNFVPTCVKAYNSEISNFVFVGSDRGDIYGLYSQLNPEKATIEVDVHNLSTPFYLSIIRHLFRFTSHIIFLSYDITTSYLAAVTADSSIRFYKFDLQKKGLTLVSTYEAQEEGSFKEKIISINEIPISDSKTTRFVCMTESGDRLFFGTNPDIYLDDRIERLKKLYVPEALAKDTFHSGSFYLSNSFFVSKNSLFVFRPFFLPHKANMSPPEICAKFEVDDLAHALNIAVTDHPYRNQPFSLFCNDLLWQHIMPPPVCYLMCTNCFYEITLQRPVDALENLILQKPDAVYRWMRYFSDEAESAATALLLASEVTQLSKQKIAHPKTQDILSILLHFSDLPGSDIPSQNMSTNLWTIKTLEGRHLSATCAGFLLRATRLLSVFWDTPVLTKDLQNKYCLSPIFKELPSNLTDEIEKLIQLSEEYKNIRFNSPEYDRSNERKVEIAENSLFEHLNSFLKDVIENIKFLKIPAVHAKIRAYTMPPIDQDALQRLLEPFGSEVQKISLFDALRELAAGLLSDDRNIFSAFSEECPNFFSHEDQKFIDAIKKLKNFHNPSTSTLNEVLKISIKHINRWPYKFNYVVKCFHDSHFEEGIIKLCLHQAHALDSEGKALQWYKGDRNREDEIKRSLFDSRYHCYEYIFNLAYDRQNGREIKNKVNIDEMLKSTDELFHACFYHWMLMNKHGDDLLEFQTPFLESYLKENAPDKIWIYNYQNGKYAESAVQLLQTIKDKDNKSKLEERLHLLQVAQSLSQAAHNEILRKEATKLEKLGKIQQALLKRMHEENLTADESKDEYLMDPQQLFQECCDKDYWDLVLKILAISGIESEQNGSSRKTIISQVWSNYFNVQLWNKDLNTVRNSIKDLCSDIAKGSDVIDSSIIMPVLEQFRLERNMENDSLWAANIMIENNFSCSSIFHAYLNTYHKLTNDKDTRIRLQFIYCIFYLATETNANTRGTNLDPLIKDFMLHCGIDEQLKNSAEKYFEKWRNGENSINQMQSRFFDVFHYIPSIDQLRRIIQNLKTLNDPTINKVIEDNQNTFTNMKNICQFMNNYWEILTPYFNKNPLLYQNR